MHKTPSKFAITLMFAASLLAAPKPADAAIYNSFEALENARLFALEPLFQSVGLFVGTDGNGADFAAGSGVLIDPYWVLTAGHVVLETGTTPWADMRFSTSPDVLSNLDSFITADLWMPFPGYTRDTPGGTGNDLGLVRLSQPIFDVTPATRFYGNDVEGTQMVMAGYGLPGVWPNPGAFDGIKRAGQNIAENFGGIQIEEQYWVADFGTSPSENPLPLEWVGSDVDSGGGWFADINGSMMLVGISSFNDGLFASTGATRVSLYNDWVDETMATNTVPEPTSLTLMAMGMLGGIGARRKRRHSKSA